MSETEFLLYLNSISIVDNYDDEYFKNLFHLLSVFFKSSTIISDVFKRKDDTHKFDNLSYNLESDIVLKINSINSRIVIKSSQVKFENYKFTILMLESILDNIFKNKLILERLRLEKNLDGLTKVQNRTAYEEKLLLEMNFKNIGIAFVDVNGLGVENNRYGHTAGDKMLCTVANVISEVFRMKDIFRIGGDEFVIICENIGMDLFYKKIEKLQELISLTEYTVSIGTVYKDNIKNIKQGVEEANILMKYNKEKFRREHPDRYENKYEVSYIGKKK